MIEIDDDLERRRQRRLRALDSNDPKCGVCGEDRWQALEAHHVAGRAHDAATVILCRNCHDVASDAQLGHPPRQQSADTSLAAVGRFLLGLADLLKIAVEKLVEFGLALIAMPRGDHVASEGQP